MDGAQYYQEFLNGEENALAQIICVFKDGLILYLNSFVHDISVAEALTEDTFVKLVLKRPNFSGRASFKTWLYKIGRNIALDYLRRSKKKEVAIEACYDLNDDEKDLEHNYIQTESKILLHRAVKKLKPEYQQVLWLIYFEEFSNKEAARILGKTTHNVETLVYRARNALKTKLIEEGYDYEKL
jgi:RNA polymerase sigma-70 factor (ECF subfamily)